jgi:hypothetical protein
MYGYAVAPFGRILLYGDSRNTEGQKPWDIEDDDDVVVSPHILSAARYSPEAYHYAMWVLREGAGVSSVRLKGHLSNYILMAGTAANNNPIEIDVNDAVMAPSRLFENYAVLKSKEASTEALYLSMLNLTGNTEYHTHFEVNALAMAGYGEILLRNAGYDGPDKDVTVDGVTATFDFIHSDSEAANTLMIGGVRHSSKVGDGITEGLTGQAVEYARGVSTTAIEGSHSRDIVFVQPSDGVHGYYLIMDHVTTDKARENVNIVWHPNAAVLQPVVPQTRYLSEIKVESGDTGPRIYTDNKAELTTFLATPPASVEIKTTVNQARAYTYAADYLVVNYVPNKQRKDILTVLFPGDRNHEIGSMKRIAAGAYSGSEIRQGAVVDTAFVSDGEKISRHGKESFLAENIVIRKISGTLRSYFVKGRGFSDGQTIPGGFKSDTAIAIYMKGSLGKMTSLEDSEVTFYYPEISSVQLNGSLVPLIDSGPNWARIAIPAGTFSIALNAIP